MPRTHDVVRIHEALMAAAAAVRPFTSGFVDFEMKGSGAGPLTAADLAADGVLRRILPRDGDGWLSEESVDDPARLSCRRVWVVDPIDGTQEFVDGIPEWCISIGLVEDGVPVAGGIYNPASDEMVVGSLETGVTYNGAPATVRDPESLADVTVLASRSETRRGEWARFEGAPFRIEACGSVAYKMALVAGGQVDATWTLVPKSEWDVAAGVALVRAAGGRVTLADGSDPLFNQPHPVFPNFVATGPRTWNALMAGWLRDTGGDA